MSYVLMIENLMCACPSTSHIWFTRTKVTEGSSFYICHKDRWEKMLSSFCRRHFAIHLLYENCWILIESSLKFVPSGSIDNKLALFQIMAWPRSGTKPLSDLRYYWCICLIRVRWVKRQCWTQSSVLQIRYKYSKVPPEYSQSLKAYESTLLQAEEAPNLALPGLTIYVRYIVLRICHIQQIHTVQNRQKIVYYLFIIYLFLLYFFFLIQICIMDTWHKLEKIFGLASWANILVVYPRWYFDWLCWLALNVSAVTIPLMISREPFNISCPDDAGLFYERVVFASSSVLTNSQVRGPFCSQSWPGCNQALKLDCTLGMIWLQSSVPSGHTT